jgi:hypothetical protein
MRRGVFRALAMAAGMSCFVLGQKASTVPLAQRTPSGLPNIPRMILKEVDVIQAPLENSGFYGSPICDSDGNTYLRTDAFLAVDKNPIWKVSPKGRRLTIFASPTEAEKEFRLGSFTVSGRGDFYAVTYDYGGETENYFLLRYGSDGEVSSKVHLELPQQLLLDELGVFASGSILVSGHFSNKVPKAMQDQPRVLVLQSDGSPAGEVHLRGEAAAPVDDTLPLGSVSMGDDGNAYLLRGPEVLVISPAGKLQRTIPVSSPATGFQAHSVQASHGVLSVTFQKVNFDKQRRLEVMFRTFDPVTGVVQAEYLPDAGISNYPLCFNPDEGYTFLGQKDGKMALVRAWVR